MNVDTTFEPNTRFAETDEPGMRALNHSAISSMPLQIFHATPGDTSRNSTLLLSASAARKIVALARAQPAPTFAGVTSELPQGQDDIEHAPERLRVMPPPPLTVIA